MRRSRQDTRQCWRWGATARLGGLLALFLGFAACPEPTLAAEPGFLGLEIQGVDERAVTALGPDYAKGIMVKDVAVGEPGAIAGFRRGDFIVEFAGSKVGSFDDLVKLIAKTKPDDKIPITVLRAGKKTELTLRLTARPSAWNNMAPIFNTYPELGLKVVTVNDEARKQFGFPWGTIGVVVQEVDPSGPVSGGLAPGDVIISANLNDIWEPRQLTRQIDEARKQGRSGVLLLVRSTAGYRYAVLPLK
jgi:serine protease Do